VLLAGLVAVGDDVDDRALEELGVLVAPLPRTAGVAGCRAAQPLDRQDILLALGKPDFLALSDVIDQLRQVNRTRRVSPSLYRQPDLAAESGMRWTNFFPGALSTSNSSSPRSSWYG
jgi:hypothetical protein